MAPRPAKKPARKLARAKAPPPLPDAAAAPDQPGDVPPPPKPRKKGGLGVLGKLAWEKSVPDLSLLSGVRQDGAPREPRPVAPPSPPRPRPAPAAGLPAALPAEAVAFLRGELQAILKICEE